MFRIPALAFSLRIRIQRFLVGADPDLDRGFLMTKNLKKCSTHLSVKKQFEQMYS
jgi:hypothetical protein